jgi:hypothetical protein
MTTRRNPRRNRNAPKRFEDEKFVSGAVDRYQHCYEANKAGKYDCINGHENHYNSARGHKFSTIEWNDKGLYRIHRRDFTETLLEFTSIWRGMGLVLPGAIVSHIGEYLRLSDVDKSHIAEDDEFIVEHDSDIDDEPRKWSCSGLPMEDKSEDEWCSDEETDDDDNWSEYSDDE